MRLSHLGAMLGKAEVDGGFDENLNSGEAAFEGEFLEGVLTVLLEESSNEGVDE